nr:HAD family hydrolase [Planctomycetota bacterium]
MTATAAIEIRPGLRARPRVAAVMFDFDGTISLIRAGWVEVMLDGMRALCPPAPGEDVSALDHALRQDIVRLAGRPTIDQMIVFAGRVRARGGVELDPSALK